MYSRAKLMVRIRRMKNVSSVLKVRLFSQAERRATAKKRKCKYLWRIKVPFSQMRDGSPYNKRKLSLEWWGRLLYRMYYSSRCTHANNMSFKWPNKKENRSFVRLKFFLHGVLRFEQWTDLLAKLDIMTPSAASSLRVSNPKLDIWIFALKFVRFAITGLKMYRQTRH